MDHHCYQHAARTIERMFEILFSMSVDVGNAGACDIDARDADLIGVVHIDGALDGWVTLCVPGATARRMAGLMVGHEVRDDDAERIHDAVGELTSIFAGGLLSRYASLDAVMSVPRVVRADDRPIRLRGEDASFEVQCMSDCGAFSFEIALLIDAPALESRSVNPVRERQPEIRTMGVRHESLTRGRFHDLA